jgi:hypothetical protein
VNENEKADHLIVDCAHFLIASLRRRTDDDLRQELERQKDISVTVAPTMEAGTSKVKRANWAAQYDKGIKEWLL